MSSTQVKYLFICLFMLTAWACADDVKISAVSNQPATITPDYKGVTVPVNIAPLNFCIDSVGTDKCAALFAYATDTLTVVADPNGVVRIPQRQWRDMLKAASNDSIMVTVCRNTDGKWLAYKPFAIIVSADSIEPTLVYRLVQPLYGTWRYMGIYQRDLTSYSETPIYENAAYHGNCVNCHSFCNRQHGTMQMHLRGDGGGTYIVKDGECTRFDTKTDSTISNFTYPYWHPSGRYIAYSVNNIFQVFHNSDPNRVEVIDDASDIVVYDTATRQAFSSPLLRQPNRLETFPAFSPDGTKLYFCSAALPDSLPENYKKVHYSLCCIDFDQENGRFGNTVDTLFNALTDTVVGGSMAIPRPSPDGRWLVATNSAYGNFMIWHKDADLWLYDLNNRKWQPMTQVNSPEVESYHSWSGNSRWLVFSSRCDDGLYTRPYFVHIAADGTLSKPFMLPQSDPREFYNDLMYSYNIPELVDGHVDLNTLNVLESIATTPVKVNYRNK